MYRSSRTLAEGGDSNISQSVSRSIIILGFRVNYETFYKCKQRNENWSHRVCLRSCEHYDERELCRRAVSCAQLTRIFVCPSHEHGKKIHHSCFFFPSSVFYGLFSQ